MKVSEVIPLGSDALDVAASYLNKKRLDLYMYPHLEVPDVLLERWQDGEPSAYIIGYVDFFDARIHVDRRVLIPRQETEQLTALVKDPKGRLLDLCCGSGAIGISLKKKYPGLDVTLVDISFDALDMAEFNAAANQVDVQFVQSNFLENVKGKYDTIVCNPPYVTEEEWEEIATKDFEPRLAFIGGLTYYEKLREVAHNFLKPGGVLYLEIGASQGLAVWQLFDPFPRELLKDFAGRDRFLLVFY